MILVTTIDGVLRVHAEIPIPNAPRGQWEAARVGKLLRLINYTVEAAEMVDAEYWSQTCPECLYEKRTGSPVPEGITHLCDPA